MSRDEMFVVYQEQQAEDSCVHNGKRMDGRDDATPVSVLGQANVQSELDGVVRTRTIFKSTC